MNKNRGTHRIPFVIHGELPTSDRKLTLGHGRDASDARSAIATLLRTPALRLHNDIPTIGNDALRQITSNSMSTRRLRARPAGLSLPSG